MKTMSLIALLTVGSLAVAQSTDTATTSAKLVTGAAMSSDVSTATTAMPAAGTSTVDASAEKKSPSPLRISLVNESEVSMDNLRGRTAESYVANYIFGGINYKFSDKFNAGIRQHMELMYDGKTGTTTDRMSVTQLMVGTKWAGFLGSNAISPTLSYYLPTQTAINNIQDDSKLAEDIDGYMGILRGDIYIKWDLNPKISAAWYLSPRQTIQTEKTYAKIDGGTKYFESVSRLKQGGYLYYNINDNLAPYVFGIHDYRMGNATGRKMSEAFDLGIGTSFSFFDGTLSLNPEIYTSSPITRNYATADFNLMDHDTINFYLATSLSF